MASVEFTRGQHCGLVVVDVVEPVGHTSDSPPLIAGTVSMSVPVM